MSLQAGDFLADEIGGGYDLVLASQILHSFDAAQCRALLAKAARALVPGGRVVVQEFLLDEGRTSPAPAAVFAINMLVNTEAGRTYTEGEVRGWLAAAGLPRIERLAFPGPAAVLVARA